jgi:O-antigen/teichoic acid export membrane protein
MTPYGLFARRVGLAGVANAIVNLRGLILIPILTKTLGADGYGIWSQIAVTVSLLVPICTLGLGIAITRFLAPEKDKEKVGRDFSAILAVASLIALGLSGLVFALSQPLAISVFGGIAAAFYIRISALLIFLAAVDNIMISYFQGFQQIRRYSVFLISQTVGELALIAWLVLSGFGLLGAIVSLLSVRAVTSLIGLWWIRSDIRIPRPSLSAIRPYLSFSLPIVPTSLCYWLVNVGDRYVIGYFMGAGAVGIYSASYGLGSLLVFFYAPLSAILLPAMVQSYENNSIGEVKTYLKYSLKFFLMFAIPSFFGLSILSKSLLTTLATSDFVEAYMVVPIVALATLLFYCSSVNTNILYLFKETKRVGVIFGAAAAINVIMNIALVPRIGIIGAAIATLVTFVVQLSVISRSSSKRLSYGLDFKFVGKSVIASIPMTVAVWKLNPYGAVHILISIGIAAAIYFGVLILLRGFTREEFRFLRRLFKM